MIEANPGDTIGYRCCARPGSVHNNAVLGRTLLKSDSGSTTVSVLCLDGFDPTPCVMVGVKVLCGVGGEWAFKNSFHNNARRRCSQELI